MALTLIGCSPAKLPTESGGLREELHDVKVLSADALVIDGRHVRLANATGPQLAPRARCWAEAVAAHEVRRRVVDLVTAAQDIKVAPTGELDEFDRAVSNVSLDGLDLGEQLIRAGVAAPRSKEPFDWCAPMSTNIAGGPPISALMSLAR